MSSSLLRIRRGIKSIANELGRQEIRVFVTGRDDDDVGIGGARIVERIDVSPITAVDAIPSRFDGSVPLPAPLDNDDAVTSEFQVILRK